jgi:hypothetical protein
MTILSSKFETHKEALKENLEAVKVLLDYDKSKNVDLWESDQGCLGYSGLILLCTFINAFGYLFYGDKIKDNKIRIDKDTFLILNSDYFDNQNIEKATVDKLYSNYRNKLTHNLTLPSNFYIERKSKDGIWYQKDSKSNAINIVYLVDLYELCKSAYNKLDENNHLGHFSESKKYLEIDKLDSKQNPSDLSQTASGNNPEI